MGRMNEMAKPVREFNPYLCALKWRLCVTLQDRLIEARQLLYWKVPPLEYMHNAVSEVFAKKVTARLGRRE